MAFKGGRRHLLNGVTHACNTCVIWPLPHLSSSSFYFVSLLITKMKNYTFIWFLYLTYFFIFLIVIYFILFLNFFLQFHTYHSFNYYFLIIFVIKFYFQFNLLTFDFKIFLYQIYSLFFLLLLLLFCFEAFYIISFFKFIPHYFVNL
jgi:hypothetical protein